MFTGMWLPFRTRWSLTSALVGWFREKPHGIQCHLTCILKGKPNYNEAPCKYYHDYAPVKVEFFLKHEYRMFAFLHCLPSCVYNSSGCTCINITHQITSKLQCQVILESHINAVIAGGGLAGPAQLFFSDRGVQPRFPKCEACELIMEGVLWTENFISYL